VVACGQDPFVAPVPTFDVNAALTDVYQQAGPTSALEAAPPPSATVSSEREKATGQAGGWVTETAEAMGTSSVESGSGVSAAATLTAWPDAVRGGSTPVPAAASATPTRGPQVTRTPGPPAVCPAPGDLWQELEPVAAGADIAGSYEAQLLAYLNAGGPVEGLRERLETIQLEDAGGTTWASKAQVMPVDVTGNTTAEVVVSLVFFVEGQYAEGALYAFRCEDGSYVGGTVERLHGQVLPGGGPDPGIRAIQDMNGNGVNDIIFSYVEIVGTHGNFTRLFRILEWDGSGFASLIESELVPADAAPVLNGDGAILDTNGNRLLELVLTNNPSRGYPDGGPQRVRTDVWSWSGYAFTPFYSQFEPAIYRFQAVQDADDASAVGRLDRAMDRYELSLTDEGLLGWAQGQMWPEPVKADEESQAALIEERDRLAAYAQYRMVLIEALREEIEAAEARLASAADQFPEDSGGYPYVALAEEFWAGFAARQSMAAGCKRARTYALEHSGQVLEPLGSSYYGIFNRDYTAQDICPFQD
jgi:hypothetical protein